MKGRGCVHFTSLTRTVQRPMSSLSTPTRFTITNGRRSFTDEQAQAIILAYLKGEMSTKRLAEMHGVSRQAIDKMCTGVTYRDQYRKALAQHRVTTALVEWSEPPAPKRSAPSSAAMSELLMVLRAHPGRWGRVVGITGSGSHGAQVLKTMGLEVESRRGERGDWGVWARWPMAFPVAAHAATAAA